MAKKKKIEEIKPDKLLYIRKLAGLLAPGNIGNNPWAIDSIESLLNEIEAEYPEILQESVNKVKDAIQQEAADRWESSGNWGLLAMATGTGKSKIPINILKRVCDHQNELGKPYNPRVLLIVPTEKLRDENWLEEFKKWNCEYIYNSYVVRTCYASLHNFMNTEWDLVIGDEFHNITEDKAEFFERNRVRRLICLTATPPTDKVKLQILKSLKIDTIYNLPLDIAVRLKLVSPYNVTVIENRLDDIVKNVVGGTKASPFMTTEKKAYDYKTQLVTTAMYSNMPKKAQILKFRILDRMRFIKNLESRTKNAKFILEKFIRPDEKTLIFCGSIVQAEEICQHTFHSKTNDRDFEDFKSGKISRMSCVSAVNEGHNIPNIETIFIICVESGEKTITQQIGRGVRFAIGHNCRVIIMTVTDTVDEQWFKKATINLDKSKIRYVRFANLFNGVETI